MERGMGPVCAAKCERAEEQLTLWETSVRFSQKQEDVADRPG